jgi:hypothetical protein
MGCVIHKKKYRFKKGVWCKCNKPLLITHRWDKVTCPRCLKYKGRPGLKYRVLILQNKKNVLKYSNEGKILYKL